MPCGEVGEGDGFDGGELRGAAVRTGFTVGEVDGFAPGDGAGVVVAAGDAGFDLALGEGEFVGFKGGVEEEVEGIGEDGVEVFLEGGPAETGGGEAAAGFDSGGFLGELVVELIAGDGGGAAGAPGLAVEGDEADLGCGFVAAAALDEDGAVDERELVVFLEEDGEAVFEDDLFGLDGFEVVEGRDGNLFPRLGVGREGLGGGDWARG